MSFGGLCDYEIDDENCLLYFFYVTADQINLSCFPDVFYFRWDLQSQ